jgi:hypothetical protein
MPTRDDHNATVVVIELGPGHIYVKIVEPKPEPQRVEVLLRQTVAAWFAARPEAVINRTQTVIEGGETLGIQVWYDHNVVEHRPLPPFPPPTDLPSPLTIEVSEPVLRQLPKEHLEAVVDEAVQVWRSQPDRHVTLAVVNARRIVVILDGIANRAIVLPVEGVLDALDDGQRGRLQTWLGSLPTRLQVIEITGSWFAFRDGTRRRDMTVEPGFVRTNMTYDSGTRPHTPDRDR